MRDSTSRPFTPESFLRAVHEDGWRAICDDVRIACDAIGIPFTPAAAVEIALYFYSAVQEPLESKERGPNFDLLARIALESLHIGGAGSPDRALLTLLKGRVDMHRPIHDSIPYPSDYLRYWTAMGNLLVEQILCQAGQESLTFGFGPTGYRLDTKSHFAKTLREYGEQTPISLSPEQHKSLLQRTCLSISMIGASAAMLWSTLLYESDLREWSVEELSERRLELYIQSKAESERLYEAAIQQGQVDESPDLDTPPTPESYLEWRFSSALDAFCDRVSAACERVGVPFSVGVWFEVSTLFRFRTMAPEVAHRRTPPEHILDRAVWKCTDAAESVGWEAKRFNDGLGARLALYRTIDAAPDAEGLYDLVSKMGIALVRQLFTQEVDEVEYRLDVDNFNLAVDGNPSEKSPADQGMVEGRDASAEEWRFLIGAVTAAILQVLYPVGEYWHDLRQLGDLNQLTVEDLELRWVRIQERCVADVEVALRDLARREQMESN